MNKGILIAALFILALASIALVLMPDNNADTPLETLQESESQASASESQTTPPEPQSSPSADTTSDALIKSIGIQLEPYDAQTGKAGDLVFTKQKLTYDRLFMEYGYVIPANSAGPEKKNLQPIFIAPLGTPVRSLVDGTVVGVKTVWSGDYTIHVKNPSSDLIFETEHVINPLVREGDSVIAGQIIAEVSDYDTKNYPGMGILEIGILQSENGHPYHLCPFLYLHPSIEAQTYANILALYDSWNTYKNADIYTKTDPVPGCLILESIQG